MVDSLLNVLESQTNDSLKINTLTRLFYNTVWSQPESSKAFALQKMALATKNDFKLQLADANYNLGVYFNNIVANDSAKFYYRKSANLFRDIDNKKREAASNHALAIIEHSVGNYGAALDIVNRNIDIFTEIDSTSMELGVMYDFNGQVLTSKGDYDTALESTLIALRILEPLKKSLRTADALTHLGAIENKLTHHDKALEYLSDAAAIYRKQNDTYYLTACLNAMGETYILMNDLDAAVKTLEESIAKAKEIKQTSTRASAMTQLADVYIKRGQLSKAIPFLEESIVFLRANKAQNELVSALITLGSAYIDNKQFAKAIDYLNEANTISKEIEAKDLQAKTLEYRSQAYELSGNIVAALDDQQSLKAISDTIFNTQKSEQIETLRAIYDTEKKEQEIRLQKNEIATLEKEKKITLLQRTLLGLGLLTSFFFIYALSLRAKKERLLKEQNISELNFKKKELTTHALNLARKNEVLEGLKQQAQELKNSQNNDGYQHLIRTIDFDLKDDNNWENFSNYFQQVHKDFNSKMKQQYPTISASELRFLSLVKMNLSSKEIASILNISNEGIKKARYRVRKKLNLSPEDSLEALILSI